MIGRWPEFFAPLGFRADEHGTKGGPCPKCGGSDRFSAHRDFSQNGRVFCRKCFSKRNGDGLATVGWWTGWSFGRVLDEIANFVGGGERLPSCEPRKHRPSSKPKRRAEPTPAGLNPDFGEWVAQSEKLMPLLIPFAKERGIDVQSLVQFGFRRNGRDYSFPERYPSGRVACEVKRHTGATAGNRYRCGKGQRRQFGYPLEWIGRHDAILIPEGVLDAAALHSAGIDAISRHSLLSDLRPLVPMIAALPREKQIVVMIENDSPEVMPERIAQVTERVAEFATEARRDVWIARYPERLGKDANDCWRAICDEVGDTLTAGRKLLTEILEQAVPVEWAGPFIEENIQQACLMVDMHLAFAKQRRTKERAREENSPCGFFKTHKRHQEGATRAMSALVHCGKWACGLCRVRLIDTWYCHLLVRLAELPAVFVTTLQAHSNGQMDRVRNATIKKINRRGGLWAVVNQRDAADPHDNDAGLREAVVFSSVTTDSASRAFTLTSEGMEPLAGFLLSTLGQVDCAMARPITTTRHWSRSEKPTVSDWIAKLRAITSGEKSYRHLKTYRGLATAEESLEIRRQCRQHKKNYIGVRLPDGEYIVTDLPQPQMNTEAPPVSLDDSQLSAGDFFASGSWYPKPSKGWEGVWVTDERGNEKEVNVGPRRLREAAESFGYRVTDIPTGATSAIADAAVATIPPKENHEEIFFRALAKNFSFS